MIGLSPYPVARLEAIQFYLTNRTARLALITKPAPISYTRLNIAWPFNFCLHKIKQMDWPHINNLFHPSPPNPIPNAPAAKRWPYVLLQPPASGALPSYRGGR